MEDGVNFLREEADVAEVVGEGLAVGSLLLHFSSHIIIIVLFSAGGGCPASPAAFEFLHLRDLKNGVTGVLTVGAGAGVVELVLGDHLDDGGGVLEEKAFVEILGVDGRGGARMGVEVVAII